MKAISTTLPHADTHTPAHTVLHTHTHTHTHTRTHHITTNSATNCIDRLIYHNIGSHILYIDNTYIDLLFLKCIHKASLVVYSYSVLFLHDQQVNMQRYLELVPEKENKLPVMPAPCKGKKQIPITSFMVINNSLVWPIGTDMLSNMIGSCQVTSEKACFDRTMSKEYQAISALRRMSFHELSL